MTRLIILIISIIGLFGIFYIISYINNIIECRGEVCDINEKLVYLTYPVMQGDCVIYSGLNLKCISKRNSICALERVGLLLELFNFQYCEGRQGDYSRLYELDDLQVRAQNGTCDLSEVVDFLETFGEEWKVSLGYGKTINVRNLPPDLR